MFLAWLSLALQDAKEQRKVLGRENLEQSVSRPICDGAMPAVGVDGVAFLGTFDSTRLQRLPRKAAQGLESQAKNRDGGLTARKSWYRTSHMEEDNQISIYTGFHPFINH